MKTCFACKEPIHDDARKCPHCHQIQTQTARFVFSPVGNAMIIGCILLAIAWSAYSIYTSTKDYPLTESFMISKTTLTKNTDAEPAQVSCFAEIENTTDTHWSDFSIQANFYDQTGNLIDTHHQSLDTSLFPFLSLTARVTGSANAPISQYYTCKIKITDAN